MSKMKLTVAKSSLILFVCLVSYILRDCIRVLGGRFILGADSWEYERYTGLPMTILAFAGVFFLIIYVLFYVKDRLPFRLRSVVYIIILLSIFWTIHSCIFVPGYSLGTLDGTAKTVCLSLLGLYLGYDEQTWAKIKRAIPSLAVLYMTITFGYVIYIRVNGMWHQQTNQAPYWMTYSTAIWLFAYLALCFDNEKKKDQNRLLMLFFMNAFIVAFTISRGWLLQTVFLMLVYLTTSSSSKKTKRHLIFAFVILMFVGAYFIKDDLVLYITSYVTKFKTAATRESQYASFFSQISVSDLILGKGEYASYVYRNNPNYIYIDNSFLYYAFHFGIVYAVLLLAIELLEAVKVLRVRKSIQERKIGVVILMWIAALMGASVFCAGYEISFRVLFAMTLVGRASRIVDLQHEEKLVPVGRL